jgi:PAS domain S-box-containing protein
MSDCGATCVAAESSKFSPVASCERRASLHDTSFIEAVQTFARLKENIVLDGNDSLILTSAAKGFPIVHVSPGWEQMCGWKKEEAVGRSANINQGPNTSREVLDSLGRALMQQKSCKVQLINYRKDGSMFWNVLSLSPILENGKPVLYAGHLQDYTYKLSKFVNISPQQFYIPKHFRNGFFHSLIKGEHVQVDSPSDAMHELTNSLLVTSLGFPFAGCEPEYVFHRLMDAAIDLGMTIARDPSKDLSALTQLQEDGRQALSMRVSTQSEGEGNGTFQITRLSGDTWKFHEYYRGLIDRTKDLINSNHSHALTHGADKSLGSRRTLSS